MSKAVLISIQPKWCEKILNGEKTIEIRKTKPNLKPPFKCYIYCTKAKTNLVQIMKDGDENYGEIYHGKPVFIKTEDGSVCDMYGKRQKVVAEFICDRIIGVDCDSVAPFDHYAKEYIPESCVSKKELIAYSGMKLCFGWYISDLKVYDEPKPLSEFWLYNEAWHEAYEKDDGYYVCGPDQNGEWDGCIMEDWDGKGVPPCYECWEDWNGWCHRVKRAPQSWCYVEETE